MRPNPLNEALNEGTTAVGAPVRLEAAEVTSAVETLRNDEPIVSETLSAGNG